MQTESLALPLLPGRAPRQESSDSLPGRSSSAIRRRHRLPGLQSLIARGKAWRDGLSVHDAERRVCRLARRGQPIALGALEQPYEPLAQGAAPLAALRRFDGLAITITTRSSEILEHLDLLIELDQRHVVSVDVLVAFPDSPDRQENMRAVSALSSHGITTRLVFTDVPCLPPSGDVTSGLRRLFEAARACRAFDVAATFHGVETAQEQRLVRHLRLEMAFPDTAPGRG